MNDTVLGFIGALIAAVFFGSNYIPTKNYPTGDGVSFVWVFSSGVLVVGISTVLISGKAIFVYTGLLGGSLWASGNMCVVPIVKTIGLGLGLLLWGSSNLLTGFFVGKFGIFGVEKKAVDHEAMNWIAIVIIVAAMGIFFFIKPNLDKKKYEKIGETNGDLNGDEEEESFFDRIPVAYKKMVGIILAVVSGMLYGVNMVPMTLWVDEETNKGHTPGTLDFVLSHFIGIYLYSTAVFIVYCIVNRPPKIYPAAILPSVISGAMWGVAQCGLMTATQLAGYSVGFPMGAAGPLIVSSLWSVFYFREIRGAKNLVLLGGSITLLMIGILLLALSGIPEKTTNNHNSTQPLNSTQPINSTQLLY
jgi:glucose uptake protein GlcU